MSNIGKPARGWLHPDHLLAKEGINYNVRYVGSLEVNSSMKVLDFDTRSLIAKECIHIVCQAAEGGGDPSRGGGGRKSDKKITRMLGTVPVLDRSGSNVQLTITSLSLKLSHLDTGNPIYEHEMPNISFASGGDTDTQDYVAYVAKDKHQVRSCFVLECKGGVAQEVITTIGQAFELRFKEFLKRTPVHKPPPLNLNGATAPAPMPRSSTAATASGGHRRQEVEYYNDLPGKSPPESSRFHGHRPGADRKDRASESSNLIDFNTPLPNEVHESDNPHSHRDPFDMSPFAVHPPENVLTTGAFTESDNLKSEIWFHGPISRRDAEMLLHNDGDFLVRESQGSQGQYVLTGMQQNSKKHLLLVDPEGVVRTKDRAFDCVSHLINHHMKNGLPIISAESALRLKMPIDSTKSNHF